MVTARQLLEAFPPKDGINKLGRIKTTNECFSIEKKRQMEEDRAFIESLSVLPKIAFLIKIKGSDKIIAEVDGENMKYLDLDDLSEKFGLKYDVLIGEYIKIKVKMKDSEEAAELYNTLKSGEVLLGYSNFLDKNEVAIFKAEKDSDVKFILREGYVSIIANLKYLR